MTYRSPLVFVSSIALVVVGSMTIGSARQAGTPSTALPQGSTAVNQSLVTQYCVTCHNQRLKTAGLQLDAADVNDVSADAEIWEKVIRKLRSGAMPPPGRPRPEPAAITSFVSRLEASLDRAAAAHPNPGRTEMFHRLNRAEYQ